MKKSAVAILVQKLIPYFKAPLRASTSALAVSMAFRASLASGVEKAPPNWPNREKQRLTVETLAQEKSSGSTSAIRKTKIRQKEPSNEKLNPRQLASNF
jgi:hypothetical protein